MSTASFRIREHVIPTSHIREYPRATSNDQEDALQLAIKQYIPKETFPSNLEAVTIIGAHANGFPKELYEPLWDDLYEQLKVQGIQIRSIWIADVAQQGASGVLNERELGNDPSWMDHPRDLFLMVNHFRSQIKRPLIGIGHSMGGNNLINLSLMHPRLFTTLVLIDPVVQRYVSMQANYSPAKASTVRRDRWPNRKAASEAFSRSKFYQTWDPRVLAKWVEHGLRELPTHLYPDSPSTTLPTVSADPSTATVHPALNEREVTLKTTKHQEVLTFLRPNFKTAENPFPSTHPNPATHPDVDLELPPFSPFYLPVFLETFKRLPFLRPSVCYIFGEYSHLSTPLLRADKLAHTGTGTGGSGGVKKGRVTEVLLHKIGHLIPMETSRDTAQASAGWIASEIKRWSEAEETERKEWAAVPYRSRSQLSEQYKQVMMSDWMKATRETYTDKGSKL